MVMRLIVNNQPSVAEYINDIAKVNKASFQAGVWVAHNNISDAYFSYPRLVLKSDIFNELYETGSPKLKKLIAFMEGYVLDGDKLVFKPHTVIIHTKNVDYQSGVEAVYCEVTYKVAQKASKNNPKIYNS